MIKNGFGYLKAGLYYLLSCLSPSNIKEKYLLLRSMTLKEIGIGFLMLNFNIAFGVVKVVFKIIG